MSAGVAGGGSGLLTTANTNTNTVSDTSAASASSGVSVALAPTPSAANAAPLGVTTANSGASSATGVTASNTVHNTALQAVSISGASNAPVTVASNATVTVDDTGASAATSGAAWAVAAGADGAPSNVATPDVAGASAASGPLAATGNQVINAVATSTRADVTTPGGPSSGTINIEPTAAVKLVSGGMASVQTGAASGSAAGGGSAVQAASGAASAQGLTAQNQVNTNADVSVKIAGQNFAPITVIVNSITQIYNWGVASATSGDTTATGSGSPASVGGQNASSGSAQATGAQVQNTVNLSSSASVHVAGDNYNPINIVLKLAATLWNWGVGVASSGDAQSQSGSGGGGGTATSGSASATGLLVLNVVNMWADASVEIAGNNYAPITVDVIFDTSIANGGYAQAQTGNVAAGTASATTSSTTSPATSGTTSGSTSSSGGAPTSSQARSGNAVAISNSADSQVASNQISSANGGLNISTTGIATMLRNLPTGSWSPFVAQNVPQTSVPAVVAGLDSGSGNSVAQGVQLTTLQENTQIAACSDPGVACVATNTDTHSVTIQDSAKNPAIPGTGDNNNNNNSGGTHSESGFGGVNATPTPTPAPNSQGNGSGSGGTDSGNGGVGAGTGTGSGTADESGGGSGGRHQRFASQMVAADLVASGHMVLVDLWDQWPGRRLPPMPNLVSTRPESSTVSASLGGFPGVDELPVPDQQTMSPAGSDSSAAPSPLRRIAIARSGDAPAESDTEVYPLLGVRAFDVWSTWPGVEALPLPAQAPAAAGTSQDEAPAVAQESGTPTSDGVSPIEADAAVLLAIAFGPLVGLRRGRWLAMRALRGLARPVRLTWLLQRPGPWFRQHTLRGLAVLRLVLGILRSL